MLSLSMPSLSSLLPWRDRRIFAIPSVEIHAIDDAQEKPSRAVKHLLKLNHASHAVLGNKTVYYHNHMSHALIAAYLQGAGIDSLNEIWEAESKHLEPWVESPIEISTFDWREYLGRKEYQRAFVDFFEDQLVNYGYDWKSVVFEYLFSGKQPLFNSIVAESGFAMVHLAGALQMSSRETGMEALALAATCYGDIHKYLDDPAYSQRGSSYHSTSVFEILEKIRHDKEFDSEKHTSPGKEKENGLSHALHRYEGALLNHWNAYRVDEPMKQLQETHELAVALVAGTKGPDGSQFPSPFIHILTLAHDARVLLPIIPPKFQLSLVKQWLLTTLGAYVALDRPEINIDRIHKYDPAGLNWKWTMEKSIGRPYVGVNYVKGLLAIREMANLWGDPDGFYLKAAVRFADEFPSESGCSG